MGGTTAKVGLIQDGQPSVTKEYDVGGHARPGIGADVALRLPDPDAGRRPGRDRRRRRIDRLGRLRRAAARRAAERRRRPGPVCYGGGGTEPTVTDANVVLGRLNPDFFLGGEMRLDVDAARAAIEERCAEPLGLSVVEAAYGIVEIANAAMVNALHLISVQRGYDPRDFVLVAFGGAGPVHANAIARDGADADAARPAEPGDLLGDRAADDRPQAGRGDHRDAPRSTRRTRRRSRRSSPSSSRRGRRSSRARGSPRDRDRVPAPARPPLRRPELRADRSPQAPDLLERFHAQHERTYGFAAPDEPVEIVSLRLTSVGRIAKPPLRTARGGRGAAAPKAHRPVYFAESGGYVDCPIHDR